MRGKMKDVAKVLRGNRGSGLVLVLVCMLCVSILGIMVLYLSYTGMLLKITERQSKNDFYSATTAMDEVRAGVQKAASDSISQAYKTVLINYSSDNFLAANQTMEAKFKSLYLSDMKAWSTQVDGTPIKLINSNKTYNIKVLQSFTTAAGAEVISDNAVVTDDAEKIVLKNVTVKYTDSKHYATVVNTDIVIWAPDLSYMISNYSISGLPAFALIAQKSMKSDYGTYKVTGSAYAGSADISGTGMLQFSGGQGQSTIVFRNVTVNGNPAGSGAARFTADANVSLWTNRIQVGARNSGSSLVLSGSTYVQDDLDIAGPSSSATLSGSYFGFGASLTDATKSSAILVNGRNSALNISGLDRLVLAGHSFISNYNMIDLSKQTPTDVLMGESMSVRGNQSAYLAPEKCFSSAVSNPYIYSGDSKPTVTLDNSKVLWGNKKLSDYGAELVEINANYPGSTGQHIVYYFLKFGDRASSSAENNANAFFSDYFTYDKTDIQKYMQQYLNLTSATGITQSAGYTIKKNSDGSYSLVNYADTSFATMSKQMTSTYNQLSTTLFESTAGVDDRTNPYNYFVRTDLITTGMNKTFTDSAGKTVGVVTEGDYTIDGTNADLRVVIASGTVTVNKAYTGLIIAGQDIVLKQSVTADDADVTAAFAALNGTETLGSFLRNGAADTSQNQGGSADSSWDYSKLVTYQDWSKN